jgi:nucleoside phosphorylase
VKISYVLDADLLSTAKSGNSLDATERCMEIMLAEKAAVKEMEAAAIAWVARLFPAPLVCVKVSTSRRLPRGKG